MCLYFQDAEDQIMAESSSAASTATQSTKEEKDVTNLNDDNTQDNEISAVVPAASPGSLGEYTPHHVFCL